MHIAATTALPLGHVIVVFAEQAKLGARNSGTVTIRPVYSDQVGAF